LDKISLPIISGIGGSAGRAHSRVPAIVLLLFSNNRSLLAAVGEGGFGFGEMMEK
jgi:hypothetical protein